MGVKILHTYNFTHAYCGTLLHGENDSWCRLTKSEPSSLTKAYPLYY